ncbi:MAG: transposase [Candidatus Dormiibacterota bacterium]
MTELGADSPRVNCPEHGVVVAWVPRACHGSRLHPHLREAGGLADRPSAQSTAASRLRVTWSSVVGIVGRVVAAAEPTRDPLAHLEKIGIDEISWTKGQRYITGVVDHDSGRLVWAAKGRDEATPHKFFDALDKVRRTDWNQARRAGEVDLAHELKGARWALGHNPETLTDRPQDSLARLNRPICRACLLKEALRLVFHMGRRRTLRALDLWLRWVRPSQLKPLVKLARKITAYRASIEAALRYRPANALVESTNQKIRLIIRCGFGLHSAEAISVLAQLSLSGLCPPLSGGV